MKRIVREVYESTEEHHLGKYWWKGNFCSDETVDFFR
jgi:hypothetical protein